MIKKSLPKKNNSYKEKIETKKGEFVLYLLILGFLSTANIAQARDYIMVVGSSTVYPFATVVAETFGKTSGFKTPPVESTGSGGGIKFFCSGVGVQYPDVVNASRRIKKSEFKKCQKNGVKDIVEVKIGYDGIVLGSSKQVKAMELSRRDIFLALAKNVPKPNGSETLVKNPYKNWVDVNPKLPNIKIEVLGPPPTSGTRDAFAELVLEGGCKSFDWIKSIRKSDKRKYKEICHKVREDGAYIEVGENDNLVIQKLKENPEVLGLFGFSFLDQNVDVIQGAVIDDVAPEFELIADGSYPASRPLYFYVKLAHIGFIPGIEEYMKAFTKEGAFGEEGYLSDKGLIPMPAEEREQFQEVVRNQSILSM